MRAPDNPDPEGMLAAYKQIMDANDIIAMSFYPFFRGLSEKVDEVVRVGDGDVRSVQQALRGGRNRRSRGGCRGQDRRGNA